MWVWVDPACPSQPPAGPARPGPARRRQPLRSSPSFAARPGHGLPPARPRPRPRPPAGRPPTHETPDPCDLATFTGQNPPLGRLLLPRALLLPSKLVSLHVAPPRMESAGGGAAYASASRRSLGTRCPRVALRYGTAYAVAAATARAACLPLLFSPPLCSPRLLYSSTLPFLCPCST